MKTLLHNYSGASLLDLLEKYGTGAKGFYDNLWWKNQAFAKEHALKGKYELDLSNDLVNMSFDEQVAKLKRGFEVAHPAIVVEALFLHYANTKKYIVTNYCLRTSSLDSGRSRVDVGGCDAEGVHVGSWSGDDRDDGVGVSAQKLLSGKMSVPNDKIVLPDRLEINGISYKRI